MHQQFRPKYAIYDARRSCRTGFLSRSFQLLGHVSMKNCTSLLTSCVLASTVNLQCSRRRANNTEQSDLIKTSESASSPRVSQHSAINHRLQSKSCASWCSFLHNIYCKHVNAWTAADKPICHFKSVVFVATANSSRTKDMFGNDIINIDSFEFFSFVFWQRKTLNAAVRVTMLSLTRIIVDSRWDLKMKRRAAVGILMVMRLTTIECEKWLSQTLRNESPDCEHFHERDNKSISTSPLSTKPGNWIAEDEKLLLTSYEKTREEEKDEESFSSSVESIGQQRLEIGKSRSSVRSSYKINCRLVAIDLNWFGEAFKIHNWLCGFSSFGLGEENDLKRI